MIHLQRTLEVRSFDVEATTALTGQRPEYLAVARLAADLDRPIHARDVHRQLFGNLPENIGRIVLDRCVLLRLFDRPERGAPAVLSAAGRAALARGEILLAEEGLWRIYYLVDPLLGPRLVHALALREETSAQDVRDRLKQERSKQARNAGTAVPDPIRMAAGVNRTWHSVVDGRAFELHEIAPRGEEGPTGELQLHLDWSTASAVELALRGRLPVAAKDTLTVDRRLDVPRPCQAWSYDGLWLALAAYATKTPLEELSVWHKHTGQRVLPRPFATLDESTRRTARCDIEVPACRLGDLGDFEPTRLTTVIVVPRAEPDAQAWAEWLQWDELSTYVTPADLRAMATKIAARFPYHHPRPHDPEALLRRAMQGPADRKARYLLAPADLGLWS